MIRLLLVSILFVCFHCQLCISIHFVSKNVARVATLTSTLKTLKVPRGGGADTTTSLSCDSIDTQLTFLNELRTKYVHQPTFLQAVEEMALSLLPLFHDEQMGSFYLRAFLAMTEPERTLSFRVTWIDDHGSIQHNRGWRVEFSSVLGPYKGGLRFHPTVDEGILKFLGFEQIFKNALTGLPLGGGKGGSDFDPKGKSENEIRNFCASFMTELFRYLHPSTDVPAGDIGVGGREIGYMYGQYKRLTNKHGEGILTGKSINFSGSHLRPEATGYGLVYITKIAIENNNNHQHPSSLDGLRCAVSGSGNVAQYAAEKLIEFGAKIVTMSDSDGVLVFEQGLHTQDLQLIMECKNVHRQRLHTLEGKFSSSRVVKYIPNKSPWTINADDSDVKYDIALPCATQNEINETGATMLVKNGVFGVFEGANLPTTMEGQSIFRKNKMLYIPGKAANAGGVGVSGLEMSQNAQKLQWEKEVVDEKLKSMMSNIYQQMIIKQEEEEEAANSHNGNNPVKKTSTLEEGANRAGFIKVANAMKELGWIQ